ncbi:hypothetical protein ZHAS_00008126 [Anopheles sinensis]|uniref:Uncharacterized protein n=1 Tax=Anopheles sinensis TaxID=74873 RepID=A0A084VRM1_ANOSI|nr:hypothetical protein ZHAS_00008126 [Anopheles sinensis]
MYAPWRLICGHTHSTGTRPTAITFFPQRTVKSHGQPDCLSACQPNESTRRTELELHRGALLLCSIECAERVRKLEREPLAHQHTHR